MGIISNLFGRSSSDYSSLDFSSEKFHMDITPEVLNAKKESANAIILFEFFKSEIDSYVSLMDNVDTFITSPIENVESVLQATLLPQYDDKFGSMMAYIKILKAKSDKNLRERTLFAIDVLMYILHDETGLDCFDLIYRMIESDTWPSSHKSGDGNHAVEFFTESARIGTIVNNGILVEGGDIVKQMGRIEKNKGVILQMTSLFHIAITLGTLSSN